MRGWRRHAPTAVFGAFDGMTAVLGLLIVALTNASKSMFILAVALAVSEGLSMAAGEWLSDNDSNLFVAVLMGVATILGILLPAVPFIFGNGIIELTAMSVIVLVLGVGISLARRLQPRPVTPLRSLLETFGLLGAVIGCCTLLAVTT